MPAGIGGCDIGLALPVPRLEDSTVLSNSTGGCDSELQPVGIGVTLSRDKDNEPLSISDHKNVKHPEAHWELDIEGALIYRTLASSRKDLVRLEVSEPISGGTAGEVWALDSDCQCLALLPSERVRLAGTAHAFPAPACNQADKALTGSLVPRVYCRCPTCSGGRQYPKSAAKTAPLWEGEQQEQCGEGRMSHASNLSGADIMPNAAGQQLQEGW